MFATFPRTRNQRRGVVLILVLGMLGLLALIGVTFATYSGQVKINSRNFSQAQNWPDSTELMDYALAQLINDTDNPQSAIRGHSLTRDMYGNDAIYNGALLNGHPTSGAALVISLAPTIVTAADSVTVVADPFNPGAVINVVGLYRCRTNIATNDPAFYNYNFTRWVLKFNGQVDTSVTPAAAYVGQTHEILADDATDASGFRTFYVAAWDGSYAKPTVGTGVGEIPAEIGTQPTLLESTTTYSLAPTIPYPLPSTYPANFFPNDTAGTQQAPHNYYFSPEVGNNTLPTSSTLIGMPVNQAFALDGRFLHAFNGPGLSGANGALASLPTTHAYLANRGIAQYANFRVNGHILSDNYNTTNPHLTQAAYGFPNTIGGMDEDYDACDLENWFLALQSGDSQVMIPSFHRPGTLIYDPSITLDDWTSTSAFSASKILRPRAVDGHSAISFPNLYPNANGQITYDVDNDGDGTTDSVWLDLGYPPRRNSAGQLFKPLYAFMVIGLNGRIPLNTAGNLQLRDLHGTQLAMHASGKGYSPSEIDPSYALQNGYDGTNGYSQVDNAGVTAANDHPVPIWITQLRNLLAGNRLQDNNNTNGDNNFVLVNGQRWYVPNGVGDIADTADGSKNIQTTTTAIPGRWGEANQMPEVLTQLPLVTTSMAPGGTFAYINPIRAGLSGREYNTLVNMTAPPTGYGDARDDNHNAFDFYPPDTTGTNTNPNYVPMTPIAITTGGESGDYYDASGSLSLPVERFRRFLTPIDVLGDGLINNYKTPVALTGATYLLGSDDRGRVAYYKHYRPSGLAVATRPGVVMPNPAPTAPVTTLPIFYPYGATGMGWVSNADKAPPLETGPSAPHDRTTNLLHGFDSYRNPVAPLGVAQFLLGAMQYNNMPWTNAAPTSVPTFDQFINSETMTIGGAVTAQPSASLNEADEMSLYQPTVTDAPYGHSDLEWLYRQQDTDGASLSSRLKDLAPISFTNPADGQRRRRLFSVETWESNGFVWANDTPLDDPQFPLAGTGTDFTSNSTFTSSQSAGLHSLSYNRSVANGLPAIAPVSLPSVAHRGRKINLNFPLPVSNRYDEPVRQKWIRETYQLLKAILPPRAIDTPEELAKLSQFVVNLVDFRDPDCTATRFVNTDLYYSAPATWNTTTNVGSPAVVSFATGAETLTGTLANVNTGVRPPAYSPIYDNANSPYLVQYGMEYNPVAITEVLGFNQKYKTGGAAAPLNRLFIELVNTLTVPHAGSTACDLELNGWDFVIMPDDPTGRPDPVTGQLPYNPGATIKGLTLTNVVLPTPTTMPPTMTANPGALSPRLQAVGSDGTVHPYVFQSALPTGVTSTDVENVGPPVESGATTKTLDLTTNSNTILDNSITGVENKYYWLYLRRPANPFDTTYDANRPNENRVVVDSFRFIFNASRPSTYTAGGTDSVSPTPVAGDVYSLSRLQPFRGGHAVPPLPTLAGAFTPPKNYCLIPYGYSDQTAPAKSGATTSWNGKFGTADATNAIWHSLGKFEVGGSNADEWDFVAFNDRDFTSVAELLQVPACPPGLFTKQFTESPPPIGGSEAFVTPPLVTATSPSPTKPKAPPVFGSPSTERPQTFPYLPDEFFYTAQHEPTRFMINSTQQPDIVGAYWPDPGTGPAPVRITTDYVAAPNSPYSAYPLKTPSAMPSGTTPDYYLSTPTPNYIGGPSGAGWYKMFEFFDVPSPAHGAIGPVTQGSNYDWMRQDLRPGLLNVNLIIDEEVFFAVMSESWLKTLNYQLERLDSVNVPTRYLSPGQLDVDNMGDTRLNVNQIPAGGATPKVVTLVRSDGTPVPPGSPTPLGTSSGTYNMKNQGFMALDPLLSNDAAATQQVFGNRMKAAFSDFLKLRHGGSGYLFAHQSGPVGSPNPNGTAPSTITKSTTIAAERPFRSFSFPDINFTLLRPAALPPTTSTPLQPWMPTFETWASRARAGLPTWASAVLPAAVTESPFRFYVGDPGVKNPYLFTANDPVQPPPIPARRLFQVPDVYGNLNREFVFGDPAVAYNPPGIPAALPAEPGAILPSNASSAESTFPPAWWTTNPATIQWWTFTGDPNVNWQNVSPIDYTTGNPTLAHNNVSLVAIPTAVPQAVVGPIAATDPPFAIVPNHFLGANTTTTGTGDTTDNRQHPAFRYDWLQKVTNLTTVRTHQYAVWITVGFFEVTKQGDPSLGTTNPSLSYDRLGLELNIQSGKNIRYRSFFIIDRTRAVGFSPQAPGNFRDCIVYRQSIE